MIDIQGFIAILVPIYFGVLSVRSYIYALMHISCYDHSVDNEFVTGVWSRVQIPGGAGL